MNLLDLPAHKRQSWRSKLTAANMSWHAVLLRMIPLTHLALPWPPPGRGLGLGPGLPASLTLIPLRARSLAISSQAAGA